MSIGNIFILCFYRSVFKICQCFTATYCPQTWGPCTQVQVTREGGNKLPANVFDSNFLLLVCKLGRAPWKTRMASGWRGYVWALEKSDAFQDSVRNRLQTSAAIRVNIYSLLTYTYTQVSLRCVKPFTFICRHYQICKTCLLAKTNAWKQSCKEV
jgi:hypothetical protein